MWACPPLLICGLAPHWQIAKCLLKVFILIDRVKLHSLSRMMSVKKEEDNTQACGKPYSPRSYKGIPSVSGSTPSLKCLADSLWCALRQIGWNSVTTAFAITPVSLASQLRGFFCFFFSHLSFGKDEEYLVCVNKFKSTDIPLEKLIFHVHM